MIYSPNDSDLLISTYMYYISVLNFEQLINLIMKQNIIKMNKNSKKVVLSQLKINRYFMH